MRRKVCELIVADEPTINRRVYPRSLMEKFVNDCNENSPFVAASFDFDIGGNLPLEKVIGRTGEFELNQSGTISAQLEMFSHSPLPESLLDMCDFSPMVVAEEIERDGDVEIIKKARIVYFALTPKENGR